VCEEIDRFLVVEWVFVFLNEAHFLECAGFGRFREKKGGESVGEGEMFFYSLYSGIKVCYV